MPELSGSTWSETDGSNNSASPNGMPEGMNSSGVNNSWRAGWGALQRAWNRLNGRYASTGSANAYVLTPDVALAAYVTGERYSFRSNFANTGTATLNISGLGATTIQKMTSSGLANLDSGDIQSGQPVTVEYNGSVLVMTTPVAASGAGGGGTVTSVATGDGLSGGPITATGTVDLDLTNLTGETNPADDDEITLRDISASAYRKMTLANAMKVVTDLTEITSGVDTAADFLLLYDTTASTAKKVKPSNLGITGSGGELGTLIEAQTASASASLDFNTNLDSTYEVYALVFSRLLPATDDSELWVRVSDDGGSTFESGSNYDTTTTGHITTGDIASAVTNQSAGQIGGAGPGGAVGNSGNESGIDGTIWLHGFATAGKNHIMRYDVIYETASGNTGHISGSIRFDGNTNALDGIQLLFESGNITSGEAYLYGVVAA